MWLKEKEFSVKLGGNTYINVSVLIAFKGTPLFTIYRSEDDGQVAIDFELYDANRQKIASIRKNNIYLDPGNKAEYLLDGTADVIALIEKSSGKRVVEIKKRQAATEELDVSLSTYLPDGQLLTADPDKTSLQRMELAGNMIKGAKVGIAIN
jgi:hypothetical protein